jgi:AcrR family transcriptional regulator
MNNEVPTKQKILNCALNLFCEKGYSETSIRDIASAVGIKAGSLYNHFSSKEEILPVMLNDYTEFTKNMYHSQDLMSILQNNPTAKGITSCIMSISSYLTGDEYYLKLLHLVHQEQHRNAAFGDFLLIRFQETKEYIKRIIDILKKLNIIKDDINADYWGIMTFSLQYTLSNCIAISMRQKSQGYTAKDLEAIAKDLEAILYYMFDMMLKTNNVIEKNAESHP